MKTGDNLPSAGDNQQQYRPRESPAKRRIMGGVDGTLRGSSSKTNSVVFSAVQPHRLEVLKAASNAFVAAEQALGGVGPSGMLQGFKIASTRIEPRPISPLEQTGGRISCLLPGWVLSAALKEGVAAERFAR